MTRYTVASQRSARPEDKQQVGPLWRGIGCLMILIVPVVSYALASLGVRIAIDQNLPVPYQLMGNPVLPQVFFQPGIAPIGNLIASQQNLYAILALTVLLIVIIAGLISVAYAFIYQLVGPPRYGPLDVETPRIKVKRYKR